MYMLMIICITDIVHSKSMKALLVVDYQNDYVTGPLGSKFAKLIEKNICTRIEETLASRGDVYFLVDAFDHNYLNTEEGRRNPVKHCIWGTPGAEICGKVADYLRQVHVVRKTGPASNEMVSRLKNCSDIEVCGLETNKDVLANAVIARAANPDAKVTVRQNCVASRDSMLAEEAVDIMMGLGIEVL